MGAMLEALISLQDVEHQIVDIRRQLAAKQRAVTRQTNKLREVEQALQQAHDDLRQTQIAADAADVELKSRDAHVNKLRDNLNSVRTNKEYAAVLAQLNNEKADRNRVEGRAMELLSEVESRKAAMADLQSNVEEEQRRLANLQGQLEQTQSSFDERLAALQARRDEAAAQVDPKTMELFNRLSERYEGEVMARCTQVHPRRQEYICEGCNMSVTIERASALMSRERDEVVQCGSCGRILFMDRGV